RIRTGDRAIMSPDDKVTEVTVITRCYNDPEDANEANRAAPAVRDWLQQCPIGMHEEEEELILGVLGITV
ncbi:MAG: hypothetical protein AAGJ54_01440, partial [Planctomycetota bacterium]